MNKKKIVIIVEVLVVLILVALIIHRSQSTWEYQMDLHDFASDYIQYNEEEDSWTLKSAEISVPGNVVLLEGPYLHLKPDSYTLLLDYQVDKEQNCRLYSYENYRSLKGNSFNLDALKRHLEYDFYVFTDSRGIVISFNYNGVGDFSFTGARVVKNNRLLLLGLFLWIVLSVLINIGMFHADFIKKHRDTMIVILGITFLASAPLLTEGIYIGHDYFTHQQRIDGIMYGILNGEFPVRLETTLNSGYGCPISVFYGSLLLYVPAILRIFGFSATNAYKLYICMINFLTTCSFYFCGKQIFKKRETVYITTAAYVLSHYRLMDIFVRAAVGEFSAFLFFPLIMLALWRMYYQQSGKKQLNQNALLLGAGMTGLLYTHLLSLELTCITVGCLAIIHFRKTFSKDVFLTYVKAVGCTVLAGAAYYVPFLDYYLNTDVMIKHVGAGYIQEKGAWIGDYFSFFENPLGRAANSTMDRFSLTPGFFLMLGLMVAIILILKGKANKPIKFLSVCAIVCLFLSSTSFPWNVITETKYIGTVLTSIQFPFRILAIAIVFLSLLFGLTFEQYGEQMKIPYRIVMHIVFVIFVFTTGMFTSSFYENTYQVFNMHAKELPQYTYRVAEGIMCAGEYNLTDTHIPTDYEATFEGGKGSIESEKGLSMVLNAEVEKNAHVDIPRFNYPYYHAFDDKGRELPIEFGDNKKVRIVFPEAYSGRVTVRFIEPWFWRVAELVSLLYVVFMLLKLRLYVRKRNGEQVRVS